MEIVVKAGVVVTVGLGAYIAMKSTGREPDILFGAREGVISAVVHGIDCAIVIVYEEFTDFFKAPGDGRSRVRDSRPDYSSLMTIALVQ
jgi:predicted transcriptional regulator